MSLPGLTRQSILSRRMIDARIKSGHDDSHLKLSRFNFAALRFPRPFRQQTGRS